MPQRRTKREKNGAPLAGKFLSALALGAVIAVAARDLDHIDGRATAAARQPLSPVDLELRLELYRLAEQIHVGLVVEGRPPISDGVLHHFPDRSVKPPDFL